MCAHGQQDRTELRVWAEVGQEGPQRRGVRAKTGTRLLCTESHQWYMESLCPKGETGQIPIRKGPVGH